MQGLIFAAGPEDFGRIVREWQAHAEGKRTVVFCSDRCPTEELAAAFRSAGVGARAIRGRWDWNGPRVEDRESIRAFREDDSSAIRVLCCGRALAYGRLPPETECVIFARRVSSRKSMLHLLAGRTDLFVLDFAGLILRYGFPG